VRVYRWVGILLLGVALSSEAALAAGAQVSAAPLGTLSVGVPDTKASSAGPSAGAGAGAALGEVDERGRLAIELSPARSGRDLKAVGAGQGKWPSSVLSADLLQIPLRQALTELGGKLRAKVFMAKGIGEEAITVKFQKLPVEQGLKRILQGQSYLLIRSQVPEGSKGAEEMRIVEIRVMGQGAGGTPAVLKEVEVEPQGQSVELAGLAKQASEAERPEDRVKALKEFAHRAEPSVLGKVLVPALQDQDPRVRKLALQRMTDATDPPLEAMTEMVLRDERAALRSSAIETWLGILGAAASPTLEKALSDPIPAVRRDAQQGLELIRQLEERIIHKQQ
jgi:hypothetical protein